MGEPKPKNHNVNVAQRYRKITESQIEIMY